MEGVLLGSEIRQLLRDMANGQERRYDALVHTSRGRSLKRIRCQLSKRGHEASTEQAASYLELTDCTLHLRRHG